MMTEPMTGLYALTVLAAFIFFSWEERRDVENADDADFILVAMAAVFWPVLVAVCAAAYMINAWKKWVNRG
ncbi:TPA: hypothetical protein ACOELO_001559 [Enterobacter hormaechei subsp. xiangfangensis]